MTDIRKMSSQLGGCTTSVKHAKSSFKTYEKSLEWMRLGETRNNSPEAQAGVEKNMVEAQTKLSAQEARLNDINVTLAEGRNIRDSEFGLWKRRTCTYGPT